MLSRLRRLGIDIVIGLLAVGSAALLGGLVGGLTVALGLPVYLLWEVVALRFRDDLATRGDPMEFYVNDVGMWILIIVGSLTALAFLGRILRADKGATQHPPTPTPGT